MSAFPSWRAQHRDPCAPADPQDRRNDTRPFLVMPGPVPGIHVSIGPTFKNFVLRSRASGVSKDAPGSAETRQISLSRVGEGEG